MINWQNTSIKSWISDSLLVFVLFFIAYGAFLGSHPLFVPDDARYAEVAREMARSGDYIIPRIDGFIFIEKPPLYYWLEAMAMNLGGTSLWVARSANALLGVLGCLLIYLFGRSFYGRKTGWYASAILGSSIIYIVLTRTITTDMTLTFCLNASLLSFLHAYLLAPGIAKRLWFYAAYACAGLAVLAKGLVGIVFPVVIIGLWVLIRWDWKNLRYFYIPSGLLVLLVVALPWHILAQLENTEFFDFYIIGQHFARYATMEAKRYQPAWFYFVVVLGGFLPWTVFLPNMIKQYVQSGWQTWRQNPLDSFFSVWVVFIFTFFTISNSKLVPYILPIFPALALLMAHYLCEYEQNKKSSPFIIYAMLGFAALFIIAAATSSLWLTIGKLIEYKAMATYLYGLGLMIFITIGAGAYCWHKNWISRSIAMLAAGVIILMAYGIMFIGPIANKKSTKLFADYLENVLTKDDIVITYYNFYFDLPYYLDRLVLVNYDHREIEFSIAQEPENPQWVTTEEVWELWNTSRRVFVVTPTKFYPHFTGIKKPSHLLVETSRNLLLSNQPVEDMEAQAK